MKNIQRKNTQEMDLPDKGDHPAKGGWRPRLMVSDGPVPQELEYPRVGHGAHSWAIPTKIY